MSFCRDCKWAFDIQHARSAFWKCCAPQNSFMQKLDPVTGEASEKRKYIYCETLRETCSDDACAPEGRWFIAREQKDAA